MPLNRYSSGTWVGCQLSALVLLSCIGCWTTGGEHKAEGKDVQQVRAALEAQYAKSAQAYFDDAPEVILALRAPEFSVEMPNGGRWTSEESAAYVKTAFTQVERNLRVSFDIEALTVRGDTAIATIHQQWKRKQQKGGQLRDVDSEAHQREWWRHTPDGWRLFFIDDIHPGVWKVDGKRIDPSKPYDPNAPPYEPDDTKPKEHEE
jgi:ketosteroid isomerase-like protein